MKSKTNEELQSLLKRVIESADIACVEEDATIIFDNLEQFLDRMQLSDFLIIVKTLNDGDSITGQLNQLAVQSRNLSRGVVIFEEIEGTKELTPNTETEDGERSATDNTSRILFSRESLAHSIPDLINSLNHAKQEAFDRNIGFKITEASTEIRFFDWGDNHHKEEYKKKIKLLPLRDGEIKLEIISGTSNLDSLIQGNISSTHQYEVIDLKDNYHVKTIATILHAERDKHERIVESSLRERVPNRSRDCVQIHAPGYVDEDYWQVAFHVLYPTEHLWLYAEFSSGIRIDPDSVLAFHKVSQTETHDYIEGANTVITDSGGELQTLIWETRKALPGTDYIVLWKWRK